MLSDGSALAPNRAARDTASHEMTTGEGMGIAGDDRRGWGIQSGRQIAIDQERP
jgi:hypothetical protein